MKKVLNSFLFYLIIGIILSIFVILKVYIIKYKSVYQDKVYTLTGKVSKVILSEKKVSFVLKDKENIQMFYYDDFDLNDGDKVTVNVLLSTPKKNTIPNTFNYQKYLYNNGIYKVGTVNKIEVIKKNNNILNNLKSSLSKKVSFNPYLKLFILGDKKGIDESYNYYKDIGVAHLLAISGMHVGVFVSIMRKILFFLSKKSQNKFISIVLLFYAFITGFTASILRVVVFFIINSINKDYDFKLSRMKVFLLSLYFLILINPFFITNVGFLYSFACFFTMIIIKKYLHKNYFKNLVIITFYMTLFTLPITVSLNYEINLMVFVSNFLLIPFVSYILFPFALVTVLFKFLNPIFTFLTFIMEKVAYYLSIVNFTKIIIPKTSIVFIIIYYILLISFIYFNKKRYLVFLINLIIIIKIIPFFNTFANIIFLDVSQGDSMLYITKNQSKVYMFDTGGIRNRSVSDNSLMYLKSLGISKIDYLILTHGDYDHCGDAENVINKFKVKNVIFNNDGFKPLEKNIINILNKKNILYYKSKDVSLPNITFLNTMLFDNENDNSIITLINESGLRFLLMGDAGKDAENAIMNKYILKDITILKVGHHGSITSSTKTFINFIKPKFSIISVGNKNRFGHPNKEILNNLKQSKVYRTDQDGSILFKIKNNEFQIETYSP